MYQDIRHIKEGGTSLFLFGSLVRQYDFEDSKKDTGLDRWIVVAFKGPEILIQGSSANTYLTL